MVSSGVWCPAAQRHGCVFWKTLRALLSDSDSGRPPVANERFSHSFPCALKCQRKCPRDSNYRCYLGVTAALLLNTWNWQQAGWKKGNWILSQPFWSSIPGSVHLQQDHSDEPCPIASLCPDSAPQTFLFPAETSENLVQCQSIHSTKLSHGWIWMGICRSRDVPRG